MNSTTDVPRRAATAAGLAAMFVPRHVLGGGGYQAPSDKLRIAAVGVGGMGRRYMEGCAGENFVALCDVDHTFAAPTFRKYPGARLYRDFRQMFDKEEKNIDAVIVATPDHTHAMITLRALRAGKHVYSAKPLTHTIHEARLIAAEARRAKTATQMSVQSCASEGACAVTEILLAGTIGPVREVHMWVNHPLYPANLTRPTDRPAIPKGLDWDLWLGPAPHRPFHHAYHPWIWRSWWDFGSGTVGDMMCHGLHVFYKALHLEVPAMVHASRSTVYTGPLLMSPEQKETLPTRMETPETESHASAIVWDFPERAGMPALRLHWYDGGIMPPRPVELSPRERMPSSGLLFVGDKGKLMAGFSGGNVRLLPESRFKDFAPPPRTLPRTAAHYKEWVEACKTGKPTSCGFEFGAPMTEVALLGTIAARSASLIEWDAANMRIPNDARCQAWLNPPYRAGWSL
ncbi:MAG: Gfo/Idh/MocA family oxidoreductase [Bryobacteraceae bacterium]